HRLRHTAKEAHESRSVAVAGPSSRRHIAGQRGASMIRHGWWMLICAITTPALSQKDSASKHKDKAPKHADSAKVSRFFESEAPLTATLTLNIKQITRDKGDNAPWRAATLAYVTADSTR